MAQATHTTHQHPHPYTFEKAREAVITIKALRPALSPAERETLSLLLDSDSMEAIEKSVEEADHGLLQPLEKVVE